MTADDFPKLYREAWAIYEAFRKLGFADDAIATVSAPTVLPDGTPSKEDYIHVCLSAQGETFNVVVGPVDRPFAEAQQEVLRLRTAIATNALPDSEFQRMWEESKMGDLLYFGAMATAMVERGFALPALMN